MLNLFIHNEKTCFVEIKNLLKMCNLDENKVMISQFYSIDYLWLALSGYMKWRYEQFVICCLYAA